MKNLKYLAAGLVLAGQAAVPVVQAQGGGLVTGLLSGVSPIIGGIPVGGGNVLGNISAFTFGLNFIPAINTTSVLVGLDLVRSIPELGGVLPTLGTLPILGTLPRLPNLPLLSPP